MSGVIITHVYLFKKTMKLDTVTEDRSWAVPTHDNYEDKPVRLHEHVLGKETSKGFDHDNAASDQNV